ncbi:helix-turn-helix transcriptional regulator [Stenotrophomonas sp. 24(2023)]|uniref:AraC family transcriptional regulator n=1 Tax=Stenotrophomonas sp. 24(2023) TaxID=3068324 RepID=UPI0027DEC1E9|nr:helix-turn-helix transcriptional regulator [Stenotrophomonas sp. 24(2023)]WMJ69420.1 helix-turn-helix transcriptional regulator [Stenotrophomonas sp. 24(2023)]
MARISFPGFDVHPDATDRPAVARRLQVAEHDAEIPVHDHRKGQLVLALHGAVSCEVANALWIVPPQCGVWIPGGMPHSNRATANARLCYLFVEPGVVELPPQCVTLSISPMLREMILQLADAPFDYPPDGHTGRLARVLLDELVRMPAERLYLPVSDHPKIQALAAALSTHPEDRGTITDWARRLALGERTLTRLIARETGLSFGRWRQQLHLLIAVRELAAGVPVQRVSERLGYESVTAFITMFKKALGLSPTRYFAARLQGQGDG